MSYRRSQAYLADHLSIYKLSEEAAEVQYHCLSTYCVPRNENYFEISYLDDLRSQTNGNITSKLVYHVELDKTTKPKRNEIRNT